MDMSSENMETIIGLITDYGLKVLYAILLFIVGRWLSRKASNLLKALMTKNDVDPSVCGFVSSLVYYILLVLTVLAVLNQVGIQTTGFVAILGAAGLAVGLSLQGSLSNFASGVLILIFRPFKVGDFVEVAGVAGTVEKIHVFTTHMNTPDNKHIIVPNSSVMGGTITNYSANNTRRVDMIFGISYEDDIDKAKSILEQVVAEDERILKDPAPTIAVVELADSSVNFVVRPWVNKADYWPVHFAVTETVKKRFDEADVSIPYPQQDVHLYQQAEK